MLVRRHLLLTGAALLALAPSRAATPPIAIKVYKDPSCGCCTAWVERLEAAGFKATVEESADMAAIKTKLSVPDDLTSCHTGFVAGYAIEGHVPPADIKRLLKEMPKAAGLAVPGMPVNSPGMEVADAPHERYTVWLFSSDGKRTAFAKHGA